jgi:NAD+ kinase
VRDDVAVTDRLPAAKPTTAASALELERIALVVHPSRAVDRALRQVREWASANGVAIVQIALRSGQQVVADPDSIGDCDLVLAVGGDGTTLQALHAAATADRPVLGVACGSLGALTAVNAEGIRQALDRVAAGDWNPRSLPGLRVTGDGALSRVAINDVAVVRAGASQVLIEIHVDGQLYVRFAGDGLVAATPVGSSAYTLAAGGPILAERSDGVVLTPLAPHGGCCPPLVVGPSSTVEIVVQPGWGGARLEFDGQVSGPPPARLRAAREEAYATLVGLGDAEPLLAGLRRRKLLIDSPRVLARDVRVGPEG